MRLLSALDRYLIQLRADGRSVHTIGQYQRYVRCLDGWLKASRRSRDVRSITHETLAIFLTSPDARSRPDGQSRKEVSVNALRSSVRTFFAYCHAAGLAPRNAAALVRRAKCACPPPKALPETDCRRLLRTLKEAEGPKAERDYLLFHMLLTTGVRVGSALALDVEDVDLTAGALLLRKMKGNRPDRVAIPNALRRQLRAVIDGQVTGPLFRGGANGKPLSVRHVRRRLGVWLGRAGVGRSASPHSLRHSFAMAAYRRTGDVALVQQLLHHRSVGSTLVYARPAPAR